MTSQQGYQFRTNWGGGKRGGANQKGLHYSPFTTSCNGLARDSLQLMH